MFHGCKKDPEPATPTPPVVLPSPNMAGVMMTLSAISYVAEESTPLVIKDSIDILLNIDSLATRGLWKRVWGPGVADNATNATNLVYVTMMKTETELAYAIVIRGTNMGNDMDKWQDIDIAMARFTYGEVDDSVTQGAMDGFDALLKTQENGSGIILETFLGSIKPTAKIPLYVTGHSQGGYLAPVMAYWVMRNTDFKANFDVRTFTFAAPSVVNKSFRGHFKEALANGGTIQMYVNSLDVMPYFWTDLEAIRVNGIPVAIPDTFFGATLTTFQHYLDSVKINYYKVGQDSLIGFIPVDTTIHPINNLDSFNYYKHWVEVEHNHNNYLRLLGEATLPF